MSFRPSDSEWRNLFLIIAFLIDFSVRAAAPPLVEMTYLGGN